jgi:CheY-like chemotaxis protein
MSTPQQSRIPRVLVADDDRDHAEAMAELIRLTCAWDVRTAYGGVQAIHRARTYEPDVLLVDLEMPDLNGFDVARSVRDEPVSVPCVIAVTGNSDLQRQAGQDERFDDALLKPVDGMQVIALLQRYAETHAVRAHDG